MIDNFTQINCRLLFNVLHLNFCKAGTEKIELTFLPNASSYEKIHLHIKLNVFHYKRYYTHQQIKISIDKNCFICCFKTLELSAAFPSSSSKRKHEK